MIAARNAFAPSIPNRYRRCRQTLLAQPHQQVFDGCGVLRRAELNAQNMLAALAIDAHRADQMMRAEAHAVQRKHQQLHLIPTPLQQLLEHAFAGFSGLRLTAGRDTPTLSAILSAIPESPRHNRASRRL